MERTRKLTAVVAMAAGLAVAGCSDLPSPTELGGSGVAGGQERPFFSTAPAEGFDVLRRDVSLPSDVTFTQVIGSEGGQIHIHQAGFTLIVPAGALSEPTPITVTAVAGTAVAFEFAPHGLTFAVPATLRHDLDETEAEDLLAHLLGEIEDPFDGSEGTEAGIPLGTFLGVYYEGDPSLQSVEPLENIQPYLLDDGLEFEIHHFSGYATAEG